MTELMKRYEAETGKKATTYPVALLGSRDSDGLNIQVGTPNYIAWFDEEYKRLQAENDQLKAQLTWRPVSEKPEKGQNVLATYMNRYGKRRRVRAVYIRQYEEEVDDDCEAGYEYSEENDLWYLKEGWYELIDNWDDYSSVAIVEGMVDHWLPIPPTPEVTP